MITTAPPSALFPYTTLFRSSESPVERFSTTFDTGCDDSAIVNVSVVPASLTTLLPKVGTITSPPPIGVSSSVFATARRSEDHTSELQSLRHLVCRLLLEKKK